MSLVLDPKILVIDEVSWQEAEKKDQFLENLLYSLNFVDNCKDAHLFWCDELEELLWAAPTLPPWRTSDFRNALIPIIYKKFTTNKRNISIDSSCDNFNFRPDIENIEKYRDVFKKLCWTLISGDIDFFMVLGIDQNVPDNSKFVLSCDKSVEKEVYGEKFLYKWLENSEFLDFIWPQNLQEKEEFESIVEICISENKLYEFSFENEFIRSIIGLESRFQIALMKAIYQRLNMRGDMAVSSSLREETVNGEIRVRVTPKPTSTRLHFIIDNGKIIFKKFHGVGHHDDAL
jgi:hypothetical protein